MEVEIIQNAFFFFYLFKVTFLELYIYNRTSQVTLVVKNLPAKANNARDGVQSVSREDPLSRK